MCINFLADSISFRSVNFTISRESEILVQSWCPPVAIPIDCEDLTGKGVAMEGAHWCQLALEQCDLTSKEVETFRAILSRLSVWE